LKRDTRGFLRSETSNVLKVLTAGGTEVWKNGRLESEAGGSGFHKVLPKVLLCHQNRKQITVSPETHMLRVL
jgi:hypothetical protein